MAGDFSPLAVDASGGPRYAPPSLVVAVAAGLASMDMPIPDVAAWEWQSWKFPRAVRAGDTIYARWTLTQKRAPVKSGLTGVVVWRVDVHTVEGAICAEGEVGASVARATHPAPATEAAPAAAPTGAVRRRRRGRSGGAEQAAQAAPAVQPPAQQQPQPRPSSSRRRRRRRTGGGQPNGESTAPSPAGEVPPPPPAPEPIAPTTAPRPDTPLSRVMKRLRRTT